LYAHSEFTVEQWETAIDAFIDSPANIVTWAGLYEHITSTGGYTNEGGGRYTKTLTDMSNYRLASGSDLIDAGTDKYVREDFEGNVRPRGTAPDSGLYEYDYGRLGNRY
jgi:hypothetical protein